MPVPTLKEPIFPFDAVGLRERAVCFHCQNSTFVCTCGVDPGKDFSIRSWDIPALPQDASPQDRLARFLAMTRRHPHTVRCPSNVDWDQLFNDQLDKLLDTFPRAHPRITALIDATNPKIYSQSSDKNVLMALRLKRGMKKAQPNDLRAEARLGAGLFMTFRWSELTAFRVTLVMNAFQRSDPDKFSIVDPDLKLVFASLATLSEYFSGWTSARGWHIPLEALDFQGLV